MIALKKPPSLHKIFQTLSEFININTTINQTKKEIKTFEKEISSKQISNIVYVRQKWMKIPHVKVNIPHPMHQQIKGV